MTFCLVRVTGMYARGISGVCYPYTQPLHTTHFCTYTLLCCLAAVSYAALYTPF